MQFNQQQQISLGSLPIGLSSDSQPDTNLRCELHGSVLVIPRKCQLLSQHSVELPFIFVLGGMARQSRPRAIVCN